MKNKKVSENWKSKNTTELFEAVVLLQTADEAGDFLRDLLTEPELVEFANRWRVARMLNKNIPYSEIEKVTGMSSTTIARISKWLKNGTGGYKNMLSKTAHHHTSQSSFEGDS